MKVIGDLVGDYQSDFIAGRHCLRRGWQLHRRLYTNVKKQDDKDIY